MNDEQLKAALRVLSRKMSSLRIDNSLQSRVNAYNMRSIEGLILCLENNRDMKLSKADRGFILTTDKDDKPRNVRTQDLSRSRKMLGKAAALLSDKETEIVLGTRIHKAAGYMAEAESSCLYTKPDIAKAIREARLLVVDNIDVNYSFQELFSMFPVEK